MSRYDPARLDEARERIGALFDQPAPETGVAASDSELEALLAKASRKLDGVGEEDRSEIVDLIEIIRDAREGDDPTALSNARSQLQDLLFYLET
jgi:hypothetical protein